MLNLRPVKNQLVIIILTGILVLTSLWQLQRADQGLVIETGTSAGVPYTVYFQEALKDEQRPLIMVAHGLAGSGTIMEGFALTFAHAGYVAVTWDFNGHGKIVTPCRPISTNPG